VLLFFSNNFFLKMMMKLLPFVAAAAAEKRFLTAGTGKARVDTTNGNLLFDTAVNDAAGTAAATNAISMTLGQLYIGGKDAASSVTGLTTGQVYRLDKPVSPSATGNWKTHSRFLSDAADTAAKVSGVNDNTLPDCTNMFVQTKEVAKDAKQGTAIQASKTSGAKAAALSLHINSTASALAAADKVYMACSNKAANKVPKILKCGSTYTLGTVDTAGAGASFPVHLKTAGDVKGSDTAADHAADGATWTEAWFVRVDGTAKTINVCSAKASSSRAAAFVSGMIAYALLM
jgi:hypothetical protein